MGYYLLQYNVNLNIFMVPSSLDKKFKLNEFRSLNIASASLHNCLLSHFALNSLTLGFKINTKG